MSNRVIKKFENEIKDFQDRLTLLESKMRDLEKIPKELERLKSALVDVFGVSLSALDTDSSIRDFAALADRTSVDVVRELIGMFFKNMKKFSEKHDQAAFKEIISQYMKRWASVIFIVASFKQIEFNNFASIIIENLGPDLAKKTIALEDVVKFYGAENASRWKKLIE
jgi:hypothetical protein